MVTNQESFKAVDKEYVDSGRWKCDKSPSGAHHWMIIEDQMTCKYCYECRKVFMPPNLKIPN